MNIATANRLRTFIATTVVSMLASSVTSACLAADSSDVPRIVVKFADLNISNPQGAASLYGRIAAAARVVCRPFDLDSRNLQSQARLKACIHTAITNAVAKVAKPELVAIYDAKSNLSVADRCRCPDSLVACNNWRRSER
jgi:UrcA family protein